MSKKYMINFRFTREMIDQLKALAAKKGMNMSEFVRELVIRELLR